MEQLADIYQLLKQDERLVANNGEILKNKLFELVNDLDSQLLKLLCSHDSIKNKFFKEIEGILIFDKNEFIQLIDSDGFLPNSYTKFKDGILLSDGYGNSIKTTDNVVLEFAGKDCVLEMDSTSDDDERDELFFNEVLASSEIDQLLSPKAFTNVQRHTINGIEEVTEITEKDNLIIKGNNLLALHSLLPKYSGKIKCMYWDILYNTQSDEVPYKDTFKHSSWLTMMKNRLEVAKILLTEDGLFFIQCNHLEIHYLKIICDEIFGRDNFINQINVKVKSSAGFKTVNKGPVDVSEYILLYAKNKKNASIKNVFIETDYDTNYDKVVLNPYENPSNWEFSDLTTEVYKIHNSDLEGMSSEIKKTFIKKAKKEYALKNPDKTFRYTVINDDAGKETIEARNKSKTTDQVYVAQGKNGIRYIHKGQQITFLSNKFNEVDGVKRISEQLSNIWTDIRWEGISNEGHVKLNKGKKPEKLIKRILELATDEGDIVLDAYLGSGTTAAVAHKMRRKYIGIEQLEKHFQMSEKRLIKVIKNDKTGVSKILKWQGGGSFISCELASNSSTVIENIINANEEQLIKIYHELQTSPFISYRVDLLKMKEKQEEFENLSLLEQRQLLINLVEKNNLYINYSEIEDETYNFDAKTKTFNHNFYQKQKKEGGTCLWG